MSRSRHGEALQQFPTTSDDTVSRLIALVRSSRGRDWASAHADSATLSSSLVVAAEDALASLQTDAVANERCGIATALGEIAILLLSLVDLEGLDLGEIVELQLANRP